MDDLLLSLLWVLLLALLFVPILFPVSGVLLTLIQPCSCRFLIFQSFSDNLFSLRRYKLMAFIIVDHAAIVNYDLMIVNYDFLILI